MRRPVPPTERGRRVFGLFDWLIGPRTTPRPDISDLVAECFHPRRTEPLFRRSPEEAVEAAIREASRSNVIHFPRKAH